MILYHVTAYENVNSIMVYGLHVSRLEKAVFLADNNAGALMFGIMRCYPKIVVMEVHIPKDKEHKLTESFDHSAEFFKCRAFMYLDNIPPEWLSNFMLYERSDLLSGK